MQKAFLLLVVFSFSFCLKSVGQTNTINITFDDATYKKYVVIDTTSSFRWQVCKTNKAGFGSGTTTKVIVTDSSKSYPKNDTTRFVLKFDSVNYLNHQIQNGSLAAINFSLKQRLHTDSLKDFCLIEFKVDTAKTWDTLHYLGNCSMNYFYGVGIGSGDWNNWSNLSMSFNVCGCAERTKGIWAPFQINNTLWFRFSLITDSTFDNLPGWEIDSISFQREWIWECPSGIQRISIPFPLQISPNPSSSNFNLTTDETIAAKGFDVSVTNLLGETVFSKNEIHQASFKIDTQPFPAGIYFLKSHCSGYADANEKLVVEK